MRFLHLSFALASLCSATTVSVDAFISTHATRAPFLGTRNAYSPQLVIARMTKPDDDAPVECFLVNTEEVGTDGTKPDVVCTSEPDEYAWFNGLDRNALQPTDGTDSDTTECVEGASVRGTPEWECK
jgi:hypothetical protein